MDRFEVFLFSVTEDASSYGRTESTGGPDSERFRAKDVIVHELKDSGPLDYNLAA